jgi:hypothetical protein
LDGRNLELGILDGGKGVETGKWPLLQLDALEERLKVIFQPG